MRRGRLLLLAIGAFFVLLIGAVLLYREDGMPDEIWYPAWRIDDPRALEMPVPRDAAGGRPIDAIQVIGGLSMPGGAYALVSVSGARRNALRDWRLRREFGEDGVAAGWDSMAWYVPTADFARADGAADPKRGPDRKGRVWRRFERFDSALDTAPDVWWRAEEEAKRRAATIPPPPKDP